MKQRIVQGLLVVLCAIIAVVLARLTHTADLVTPQPWSGR